MKKLLAAFAICAGVLAFANTEFAEAAEQQSEKVVSTIQSTDVDTQQLSTKQEHDE